MFRKDLIVIESGILSVFMATGSILGPVSHTAVSRFLALHIKWIDKDLFCGQQKWLDFVKIHSTMWHKVLEKAREGSRCRE